MKKNNHGFTLVELLATLVVLGIITGLTIVGISSNLKKTKEKTEDVFVKTLEDAIEIYLDSDAKKLTFTKNDSCTFNKTHGKVELYMADAVTFANIMNSSYKPLGDTDYVNPANEKVACNKGALVSIYRDSDYVYYYKVDRNSFSCLLNNSGYITNLPNNVPSGC